MAIRSSVKLGIFGLLGALICAAGGIMFALFPQIIESKINEKLRLINGTEAFNDWLDLPAPIYFQIYVFNVTNSKDVQNFGAKPIVQQLGPYTYREYRKKRNITWSDGNRLISFYQDKYYVFLANMSSGTQEDLITTVNVPIIALTQKIKNQLPFVKTLLNNFLYKDGIFTTKTVDEFFFKGYKVEMIDKLQHLSGMNLLPNGIFGFFHDKNNTDDGLYVFNTGEGDVKSFGSFSSWNGSSTLPYWNGKYCNMINGSDGSLYPPFLTKDSIIYGFTSDVCRSIYFTYQDERVIEGIKVYRFTSPYKLVEKISLNPDNECFCLGGSTCNYAAVLNISVCNKGAPIVATGPHFYMCEPEIQESVVGLNPNKLEHETLVDLEPMTGLALHATKRLQFNVVLEPVPDLKITSNLPRMYFPLFWANESARITPEYAADFKSKLTTPIFIGTVVIYTFISLGAFIVLCVILYRIKCYKGEGSKHNLM